MANECQLLALHRDPPVSVLVDLLSLLTYISVGITGDEAFLAKDC